MVELSKPIQLPNGILIPAGTKLQFRQGTAKFQNWPVQRFMIPLQAIRGAKGPFTNACVATMLNDLIGFQETYDRKYQDWAHMVAYGDNFVIYIWDTREVIDIITGVGAASKGGPITRTITNPKTKESIIQTIGHRKYGWAKFVYDAMQIPQNHRWDNGLPLHTKNKDWEKIIADMNAIVKQKYAFESVTDAAPDGIPFSEDEINTCDKLVAKLAEICPETCTYETKEMFINMATNLQCLDVLPPAWFKSGVIANENLSDIQTPEGYKPIESLADLVDTLDIVMQLDSVGNNIKTWLCLCADALDAKSMLPDDYCEVID
jgi:hypothetical protein